MTIYTKESQMMLSYPGKAVVSGSYLVGLRKFQKTIDSELTLSVKVYI